FAHRGLHETVGEHGPARQRERNGDRMWMVGGHGPCLAVTWVWYGGRSGRGRCDIGLHSPRFSGDLLEPRSPSFDERVSPRGDLRHRPLAVRSTGPAGTRLRWGRSSGRSAPPMVRSRWAW